MYIYLFIRPQQFRVLGYKQEGPSINIGENIYLIEFDYCGVYMKDYLTIRPVARKDYGSIAHEAKPNWLLICGP